MVAVRSITLGVWALGSYEFVELGVEFAVWILVRRGGVSWTDGDQEAWQRAGGKDFALELK